MSNRLVEHIISDLRQYGKPILIIEDVHNTFDREDVKSIFLQNKILVSSGTSLSQRIDYCNSDNNTLHIFLKNSEQHLEDILQLASRITFSISDYLDGFHFETIANLSLDELGKLYLSKPISNLSKKETIEFISGNKNHNTSKQIELSDYLEKITQQLNKDNTNWHIIISLLSDIINDDAISSSGPEVKELLEDVNDKFQEHLSVNYKSLINSNPINKPKLVSKVLDHIAFNYKEDKIALVVVDGFSYWQYKMLSRHFRDNWQKIEETIHSWIPSITQLSRQAIFKGGIPDKEYIQNPTNEKKLWLRYWKGKGFNNDQIDYQHDPKDYQVNNRTKRLGIVFKDLDDKMHSSSDYKDLKSLTQHWFERSEIIHFIEKLVSDDFQVILTTDHGNVEAEGWRTLSGREKLGTNKSGSRSQRHVEYTDSWLVREFVDENEEIRDSVVVDEQAIYFKDNKSFSKENQLVSHGGSHIFEVLIPFIKLSKNEK